MCRGRRASLGASQTMASRLAWHTSSPSSSRCVYPGNRPASGLCCGLTTHFLWRAQNGKFESLHWFDSLTDEFREQERQLAELGRGAGRGGEKDQDMAQHALRMRKLRNRKAEFDLLYYAFNGARIFFRGEGAKVVAPSETAL
mgnify:CR=1 FL=1